MTTTIRTPVILKLVDGSAPQQIVVDLPLDLVLRMLPTNPLPRRVAA